jgi:4-hydroxythreonine-4-phosphate dehydrogenase
MVRVGITIGDPSGIGPEIILKAVAKLKGLAEFVIIGDSWVLQQAPGPRLPVSGVKVIDLGNVGQKNFRFGKVSAEYGKASIEYLDRALELLQRKEIECLVTGPISKEAINRAGFCFSGHTEYFAKRCNAPHTVMMLLNDQIKTVLATRHIPLKKVAAQLSREELSRVIPSTFSALRDLFGIPNPRIVVTGLNPHASDNGVIGDEEGRIIIPALKELKKKLRGISGPLPADIALSAACRKEYDCVVVMYHDQALIPLKLLGNKTGVNLTLGLPFLRTSPLHGTAFDIAGKNRAEAHSLICAIRLAVKCNRSVNRGLHLRGVRGG